MRRLLHKKMLSQEDAQRMMKAEKIDSNELRELFMKQIKDQIKDQKRDNGIEEYFDVPSYDFYETATRQYRSNNLTTLNMARKPYGGYRPKHYGSYDTYNSYDHGADYRSLRFDSKSRGHDYSR